MNLNEILNAEYGKSICECSNVEIYAALLKATDPLTVSLNVSLPSWEEEKTSNWLTLV